MKEISCDVLIIGAGIAGLTCGCYLAKKGHNVMIVEKEKIIGAHTKTKIDITESSSLDNLFSELKISSLAKNNVSYWFSRNNSFVFKSKVCDLFIKRGIEKDSIDQQLFRRFIRLGGRVKTDFVFEEFIKDNDSICKAICIKNGQKQSFSARVFVGAEGASAKSISLVGLKSISKSIHIIGYGFVGTNFNVPFNKTFIFFDSELIPGGYFFIGQTKKLGVASIVINGSLSKKPIDQYYSEFINQNQFVKSIISKVKIKSYFKGNSVSLLLDKHYWNNYLAIGDAGKALDPVFGYGVRQALISGFEAAKIIDLQWNKEFNFSDYEFILENKIMKQNKNSLFLREFYDKLSNQEIDFIISVVSKKDNSEIDSYFNGDISSLIISCLEVDFVTSLKLLIKLFRSYF